MRRAIALFIVTLIATISIPYSQLLAITINGFSLPALSGVAYAQSTYQWCGSPFRDCVPSGTETNCDPQLYSDPSCTTPVTQTPTAECPSGSYCFLPDTATGGCSSRYTQVPGDCGQGTICCQPNPGFKPTCNSPNVCSRFSCPTGSQQADGTCDDPDYVCCRPPSTSSDACNQACQGRTLGTGTTASFSTGGLCARTGALPTTTGITYSPLPNPTPGICVAGTTCYCAYVNLQSFFQGTQTTGRLEGGVNTVSLPGTGKLVDDPAEIKNPPRYAANQLDCNAPTNATIIANTSLSTVPVGTLVTVNGEIGKLTNACKGVSYSCRLQYQQGCRVQSGFFSTCVVYNACNSGDVVVSQSGSQCTINWLSILGLLLIVAGIFGQSLSWLQGLFSQGSTGWLGLQLLLQQRKQDTYFVGGCNSICGKNTGDTPLTAAPVCAGYPIAVREGYYMCRLGTCGGYEQKDVLIEIKNSAGSVIRRDTTLTDDLGKFSYTFPAPGPAGTYLVVASTENPQLNITFEQNTTG